jgi:hypothetical protein
MQKIQHSNFLVKFILGSVIISLEDEAYKAS